MFFYLSCNASFLGGGGGASPSCVIYLRFVTVTPTAHVFLFLFTFGLNYATPPLRSTFLLLLDTAG